MRTLTEYKNPNTLDGSYAWSRLVKRGYFMKGTIKPAKGGLCSKCNGSDFKNAYDDIVGYSIPRCQGCQGLPTKLKVVITIPDNEGKGVPVDLYRNVDDELLTKVSDALALLGTIHKELKIGTYRPEKYDHKAREVYKFNNFADKYIADAVHRSKLPEDHDDYISPGGLRNKLNSIKKLRKYFGDTKITDIEDLQIKEFNRSFLDKFRARDLAMGELKTMLRYAHRELRILPSVPPFPRIKKARVKRYEEIPTVEIQAAIILNIPEEKYRDMWILTASLAKRPCETRAYKVMDIDFRNKTIRTARHISKGPKGMGDIVINGRKSIKACEDLGIVIDPIDDFLIEKLTKYTANKSPDDYLFPGHVNDFVSEDALNTAWRKSCARLKVKFKPYDGTKHATLTELLKTSGDFGLTKNFSNHTNVLTLQRYVRSRAEDKREMLDTVRFR